jgi:hypothetical protein
MAIADNLMHDRYSFLISLQGGQTMKPINWKEAAELIGIFAILASLIFVALQLRQEEELMQIEMRMAMVANSVSINESIIENADVWVRGNIGEELDPAEEVIHARLVNNVNDYMFHLRRINAYRTTIDPTETISSDWIDDIESRIAIMNENARP